MFTQSIAGLILLIPALIVGLAFHEFAHGFVAYLLGDSTPKNAGRLTLNPMRHLELWGSIFLLMFGFGWAKPVPVNAAYFKNPRRDMMWVGLAGPGANLLVAFLAGLILKTVPGLPEIAFVGLRFMVQINVILAVFNLIPIPPLDGSRVLAFFLPPAQRTQLDNMENYGLIILVLMLMFLRGPLFAIINPIASFFINGFTAVPL